ncbi:MAG: hypothetical protein HOP17_17505 [Acidobacteria bacterium]|nr:hypothetical protein [Acidobacteriota bacterium]
MIKIFKESIRKALGSANVFPTVLTPKAEMLQFIKQLQPKTTNHPLIRLGPDGDGGYLVPDDLEGIEACFSPGVSLISGFESDCTRRGMKAFLADKSVDRPGEENDRFHFTKKFVGAVSSSDFMTIDDWVASSLPSTNSDLLLQIDIEGAEYEVFLSASEALMRRFRIIVVEFHSLEQLWNKPFFNLAKRAFDKIQKIHSCVHIHPNNCCSAVERDGIEIPSVMEFTFLRTDRIEKSSPQTKFPNPLDFDNTPNPTMILPKNWYSQG